MFLERTKSSEKEKNEAFYTVQEAMKKFNMTRDSVYNTLSFHQIKREKNGRYVRFLKVDFDRVMGVKK